MSIEEALAQNTSAIRDLIAAIAAGIPTTGAQVAAVVAEAPSSKKQPQATVGTNGASSTSEQPSPAAAAAQEPAPEKAAPAAAPGAASVTYEDVKHTIVKLSSAKGRDQVVAVLGEFGAAKGPDLKPEQFADFIAKATAAMAA